MAASRDRAPSGAEWEAKAAELGLSRQGRELVGPCPYCAGTDRFHVVVSGQNAGRFGCRHCHKRGDKASARRILEASGFIRPECIDAPPRASSGRGPDTDRASAARHRDRDSEDDLEDAGIPATSPNVAPGRFTGSGIPSDRRETAGSAAASRETARGAPDTSEADKAAIAVANRIWGVAVEVPAPVRAYLAARGAWPPGVDLPSAVRWLSRAAAERLNPDLPERLRVRLPDGADGCVVYAFGPPGERWLQAVQIEPLTADGSRAPWPARKPGGKPVVRQSRGPMRGTAFPVKPPGADRAGPLHIAEGPVDALAIACWRGVQAWAAGGTSGLAHLALALASTGREIVIEADGDKCGRIAAGDLLRALRGYGCSAFIEDWLSENGCESDPAEGLAGDWAERAAILKTEGGMDWSDAQRTAWNEMRPVAC